MKLRFTGIIVVLMFVLAACQSQNPIPENTPTLDLPTETSAPTDTPAPTNTPLPPTETPTATLPPTSTPLPEPVGPSGFPSGVNPLTGLSVDDPDNLERRPMGVKVQLFPRGQRPPWGISLADIVFHYYQNNGITRLHAIFYGNDAEKIGPIRSARLFDAPIVRMYESTFAFGSADSRIFSRLYGADLASRLILEGSNSCPPMCREDPNGLNLLVTNTEDLEAWADAKIDNSRQNLDGMSFDYRLPSGGSQSRQLSVRYSISSYVRWDYDQATGRYLRFEDTQEDSGGSGEVYGPTVDRLTAQQLAADNVVVLVLPHQYFFRSGNSEIIDILISGSGEAYAFRDGQTYRVTWNRPTLDALVTLTFPDGNVYPLKPGSTWYEVIGTSSQVIPNEDGSWRFQFSIP